MARVLRKSPAKPAEMTLERQCAAAGTFLPLLGRESPPVGAAFVGRKDSWAPSRPMCSVVPRRRSPRSRSARALEQVLAQIGEAVIVKDMDAVVTYWNREAMSLYG